MNHIPDVVVAALDDFGHALLVDEPTLLDERLRGDFRVRIECSRGALDANTAGIAFRLDHTVAATVLRDHGPYVGTIVDGVDSRLRSWGIDPPVAYTHCGTDEGWQVYDGTLRL
jgi:hypothetical protein